MIYTVKPGDTLTGILLAQGYCKLSGPRTSVDSWTNCLNLALRVAVENGIEDINRLTPGQQIQLPDRIKIGPGMTTLTAGSGAKETPGYLWAIVVVLGFVVWTNVLTRS